MERGKRNTFFREVEKRSGDGPNKAKLGRLNGHLGSILFGDLPFPAFHSALPDFALLNSIAIFTKKNPFTANGTPENLWSAL